MSAPKTVRGASTGATLRSRPRTATARTLRAAVPARHAYLAAAVLALSAPVGLGEAAASNDAAHYMGQTTVAKSTVDVRQFVQARASRSGWKGAQWRCIDALVYRESRWNVKAANAHSSAYGLFQFLHMKPGTSLSRQYRAFESYIGSRYNGNPCDALSSSLTRGWY